MDSELKRSKPLAFKLVAALMVMLLSGLFVPAAFAPSSASASSEIASYSLVDDGPINLKTANLKTASSDSTNFESSNFEPVLSGPVSSAVVLGSPLQTGPTVLGDWNFCFALAEYCPDHSAVNVGTLLWCQTLLVGWIFSTQACVDNIENLATQTWDELLSPFIMGVLNQINNIAKDLAKKLTHFVLVGQLGGQANIANPVTSCKAATGPSATNCQDSWFISQLSLMRQIGLFMILPLLMLAVMQSVIRGSLFFLLRSMLVMLPVAVIGSVAAVTITQLLLNISDDMSMFLADHLTRINGYSSQLDQAIDKIGDQSGAFTLLWLFLFALAAVAIYVELILRETGIYLAMLFLPLGFAALVWPSTSKWVRRLVELIIGLIFSKVFIVAALSLGITAITESNIGTKTGSTAGPIIVGCLVLIAAAFGGGKIMQMAGPVSIVATERMTRPTSALAMGQAFSTYLGYAQRASQRYVASARPRRSWRP